MTDADLAPALIVTASWKGNVEVRTVRATPGHLYRYALNSPVRYVDPDGRISVDTIWDVGNVLYDLGKAGVGAATGNLAMVAEGLADAALDTAAAFTPHVPAGGSKLARALGKNGKLQKGQHAHHGVAKGAKKAEEAREKLKHLGIDLDDIDNGVGLPASIKGCTLTNIMTWLLKILGPGIRLPRRGKGCEELPLISADALVSKLPWFGN